VFGVLTSEIAKIKRKILAVHALSGELWSTGNTEARTLALLIANPARETSADADAFPRDGPVRFVGSYLSDHVARSPVAEDTMGAWMKAKNGSARLMGHGILAARPRGA